MSPAQAQHAARARFGNSTAIAERSREVWTFARLESLLRDFRFGARALHRTPLFTCAAAGTLALGIGATVAIFSLIDAVLLRGLPFPEASRIVVLWERPPKTVVTAAVGPRRRENPVSPANFLDWRDRSSSFDGIAAMLSMPMGLSGYGEPRAVGGVRVSADFFRILGVPPLLGRTFDANDDLPDGPRVAVLSYTRGAAIQRGPLCRGTQYQHLRRAAHHRRCDARGIRSAVCTRRTLGPRSDRTRLGSG